MTTETKRAIKLLPSSFGFAHHKRNLWQANPPADQDYKLLFESDYWAHCAERVRPGDLIEVVPEDMKYRALLFVVAAGRAYVKVEEISKKEFDANHVRSTKSNPFSVKFNGPKDRYTIFRNTEKIQAGFGTEEEAIQAAALMFKEAV